MPCTLPPPQVVTALLSTSCVTLHPEPLLHRGGVSSDRNTLLKSLILSALSFPAHHSQAGNGSRKQAPSQHQALPPEKSDVAHVNRRGFSNKEHKRASKSSGAAKKRLVINGPLSYEIWTLHSTVNKQYPTIILLMEV